MKFNYFMLLTRQNSNTFICLSMKVRKSEECLTIVVKRNSKINHFKGRASDTLKERVSVHFKVGVMYYVYNYRDHSGEEWKIH